MRRASAERPSPVLLVCSSGGHLLELLEIADAFPRERRHWVTFDRSDAQALLADETVTFAHWPTNRNIKNLARNAVLAWKLIRRMRPAAIVSTGAGVAVPFLYAGRLWGSHAVYVESLARIDRVSLSGRMVAPVVHDFFVQWPELVGRPRKARYAGAIISLEKVR